MDRSLFTVPLSAVDTERYRLRIMISRNTKQIDFHLDLAAKLEEENNQMIKKLAELPSE